MPAAVQWAGSSRAPVWWRDRLAEVTYRWSTPSSAAARVNNALAGHVVPGVTTWVVRTPSTTCVRCPGRCAAAGPRKPIGPAAARAMSASGIGPSNMAGMRDGSVVMLPTWSAGLPLAWFTACIAASEGAARMA